MTHRFMRVTTQAAYILHKRAYRETSQILEVFTRDYGRLSLLSRGSRASRSKTSGLLQLFQPLVISWQGRGDLPYLSGVEMADCKPPGLKAKSLLSAMYINELMVYLLHKNDVHENIFDRYHAVLFALKSSQQIELDLRLFERDLLQYLGFGMNLECDADTGEALDKKTLYAYHFEHGPVSTVHGQSLTCPVVSGDSLMSFNKGILESSHQRTEIKMLMRYVLSHHLGSKKLKKSRFISPFIRKHK